jgi:GxxExxY protein
MTKNEIARTIVDASIEVHRVLGGPGLLESVYEEALAYELELRGLGVQRQTQVPLLYKGRRLSYRPARSEQSNRGMQGNN